MNHEHPHYLHGVGYLLGSASLTGVTAELAQYGWTPSSVATLLGAATAFVMALVSLSRELRFWMERQTTAATASAAAAAATAATAAATAQAADVAMASAEKIGLIKAEVRTQSAALIKNTDRITAIETAAAGSGIVPSPIILKA